MKAFLAVLMTGALALPTVAQKLDLRGTWKLDKAKSFLGADHQDKQYSFVLVIDQKGDWIKQTEIISHVSIMYNPLPDSKTTVGIRVDGKAREVRRPSVFPGMPLIPLRTTAEWQADTLLITEAGADLSGYSVTKRRYFLTRNGSQLVELINSHGETGDTEQRLVFGKGLER